MRNTILGAFTLALGVSALLSAVHLGSHSGIGLALRGGAMVALVPIGVGALMASYRLMNNDEQRDA